MKQVNHEESFEYCLPLSFTNTGRQLLYIICMMIIGISTSWACGHPPPPPPQDDPDIPPPPPIVWMQNHGIDPITGKQNMWVGVEIDPELFPVTNPTVCSCAIGLPSTTPSVTVTEAKIAVTNTLTKEMETLFEFNFENDDDITEHAENNALMPNQQWTGFSTAPITSLPVLALEDDEVLKLWFNIESDPGIDLPLGLYGFSIGGDPDDPLHAPQQFKGLKVSEPESLAMIMIGTAMLLFLRRKDKQDRIASGILTV